MNSHIAKENERHIKRISQELINNIGDPIPLIKEISNHILLGNGKLLRPLLFILSCRLCNYHDDRIYFLSTVFEYIHVASLLHDDVLDNAETRRNKPSVNNKWGDHLAILEGDFLYSRSIITALSTQNFKFLRKLAIATNNMVEGQLMEMAHTNNLNLTKDEYIKIIEKKTAALLSAACGCAAIIANAGDKAEKALSEFGLYLGIAFQLIDDMLDYISSEDIFGKPVGKDLKEGKVTLPLIYALREFGKEEREKIRRLLKNKNSFPLEYEEVIKRVRETKAISHTKGEALLFIKKARNALDYFAHSAAKDALLKLSDYILHRDR